MQFEFTAFPRTTEGRGASRRMRRAGKAPGIVYGGATAPQPIELDHNALFHALAQRGVPRVDPQHEARRRRDEGAAARRADASVQERDPARRFPADRREAQDPHEGAAPLRERRELAGGEGVRRDREPRAHRARHLLPAEGPAGVHHRRSVDARRRPLGARLGAATPAGRHGGDARQARPRGRGGRGAEGAGRGSHRSRRRRGRVRRRRCRTRRVPRLPPTPRPPRQRAATRRAATRRNPARTTRRSKRLPSPPPARGPAARNPAGLFRCAAAGAESRSDGAHL